jgi:hypothetical protein
MLENSELPLLVKIFKEKFNTEVAKTILNYYMSVALIPQDEVILKAKNEKDKEFLEITIVEDSDFKKYFRTSKHIMMVIESIQNLISTVNISDFNFKKESDKAPEEFIQIKLILLISLLLKELRGHTDNQELKDVMQLITNALLVSTDDFLKQNYDTKYQNWETNDKI